MGRYKNNAPKILEDLDWLLNNLKDEQECITQGLINEPLSGLQGFLYGLKEDFDIDDNDFAKITGSINKKAIELGYIDVPEMGYANFNGVVKNNKSHYLYGSYSDIVKILTELKQKIVAIALRSKSIGRC